MKFRTVWLPSGKTYKVAVDECDKRSLLPPIETELVEIFARRNSTVLDLGAFIGCFSLPIAALGYRVLAFEANSTSLSLLRASIEKNGFADLIEVFEGAVCHEAGRVPFHEDGPHGFVLYDDLQMEQSTLVSAMTVDEVLARTAVDDGFFVKMDVEGSEVAALSGMKGLIQSGSVHAFVYEANGFRLMQNEASPQMLKKLFIEHGYESYLLMPHRLVPVEPTDFQPSNVVDYLAVKSLPAELKSWLHPRMTFQEVRSRLQAEWNSCNPRNRAYVAAALEEGPYEVVNSEEVKDALARLTKDNEPLVRKAASWFALC